MKVDANRVLERQQLEMEKMDLQSSIDIGKFHEVTEDMISDECYYLVLGIVKNRIPLMGTQEPALITADEDAIYQSTYIELFIDGESIRDINVMGMFTLEIQNTEELISAEEACETIREKYDMQILSESYTIDKVWLEYIYVPDTQADNMYTQGNIQPYWCFAITNEEGSYGERVNAVTGGDLAYGE